MARNGTGTYILPTGINPVIDGTVIDAPWANTTLNDVAAALTGSLPRDGQAPMTGTLKLADGTVGAPGIAWNSDATTGLFRPATNTLAFTAGGIEQARFTAGNLLLGSTSDTSDKLQVTGTTRLNGAVTIVTGGLTSTGAVSNTGTFANSGLATLGSLSVTGAATVGTTLGVTGATSLSSLTVSSTLGVSGATGLNSATVASTLGVTGAATFSSSVTAASFSGAGTGLTGTAASLSIGGNSGTTSQTTWATLNTTTQHNAQGSQTAAMNSTGGSGGGIMIQGPGGANPAYMSFHRPGNFAAYFGLDTDNVWKVGGWSMGAVTYPIALSGAGATYSMGISGNAATATLATKASTLSQSGGNGTAMTFNWSGQSGQPSWLWGSNDGSSHYVYNPSNFSVNYAASAGVLAHNPSRTDPTAYPVVWMPAATNQPAYSCAAVTITSSTGTLSASALYASGDITAFSDARVKTDVQIIQGAIKKIKQIRGVTFTRTDEAHAGLRQAGVIAQEVEAVLPEVVKTDADGMKSVNYGALVSLLIESIKALSAKVDRLEQTLF